MLVRRFLAALVVLCLMATAIPALEQVAEAASKYYITVDLTNQVVTVYDAGNTSDSGIVRQMICSTGKSGSSTPTGTFTLPSKWKSSERTEWYYFTEFNCYAKWATRITGAILFHSVLYTSAKVGPTSSSVNALGSRASHGCVRLRVEDAKWIAQNCQAGTKCRVYSSGVTNSTLRKRLLKSTYVRGGESYSEFLSGADSKLPLSRGSHGALVQQLQARLKSLGYLNDVVDGDFGAKTHNAVCAFQAAAGLAQTGVVDDALWMRIFNMEVPAGTVITLSQGMTGGAVRALQESLRALKMYDGEIDGDFGEATAQAVRRFQQSFGYAVTGVATYAMQQNAVARVNTLKSWYGDGEYELTTITQNVSMARVHVNSTLRLRETASTSGRVLYSLPNGAQLTVLSMGNPWT